MTPAENDEPADNSETRRGRPRWLVPAGQGALVGLAVSGAVLVTWLPALTCADSSEWGCLEEVLFAWVATLPVAVLAGWGIGRLVRLARRSLIAWAAPLPAYLLTAQVASRLAGSQAPEPLVYLAGVLVTVIVYGLVAALGTLTAQRR